MAKQVLMCPVCRQSLNLTERTWRCEQGHSYDVAKQGYVNLHVVQHKHSKNLGIRPSQSMRDELSCKMVIISLYSRL